MNSGVLEKVWSPFFTTRGASHHGLGLPATMHVISQTQGRVSIASAEGKGTTVTMIVPRGQAGSDAIQIGGTKNVLLIDDNDDWAKLFTELLKNSKVKLTQITDVKKLPTADMILVDENIETVALIEVLEAISKAGLESKTVVLTSAINPERVTSLMRHGMKDVTVKPYSGAEISELLK